MVTDVVGSTPCAARSRFAAAVMGSLTLQCGRFRRMRPEVLGEVLGNRTLHIAVSLVSARWRTLTRKKEMKAVIQCGGKEMGLRSHASIFADITSNDANEMGLGTF